MDHLPPSAPKSLDSELARLYEKRVVLDELIRCLERYASLEETPLAEFIGRSAAPLVPAAQTAL